MTKADHFERVFTVLRGSGFLLEADPKLPSVCGIIAGEPMRGSWWSHPMAPVIFQINEKLEDHPDVLITKLVSGKVTFVHRKFWSEILAIGTAREDWQMKGLSPSALKLLTLLDESGTLRTDETSVKALSSKLGDVIRELERRLLINGEQFHTASGTHAKLLETWRHWRERKKFEGIEVNAAEAKQDLSELLRALNSKHSGIGKLPWF